MKTIKLQNKQLLKTPCHNCSKPITKGKQVIDGGNTYLYCSVYCSIYKPMRIWQLRYNNAVPDSLDKEKAREQLNLYIKAMGIYNDLQANKSL